MPLMTSPSDNPPVCFVQDIYFKDMQHILALRSPVAKGALVFIECPGLPQGYSLITAKDIPGENRIFQTDMPVLAERRLSYMGEPVALLVGPSRAKLYALFSQCKVIADEDAPFFSYRHGEGYSIFLKRSILKGEPKAAFSRAAKIIENEYSTGIQDQWHLEPPGAVSWYEKNGEKERLFVKASGGENTGFVNRSVSALLGIPQEDFEVSSVGATSVGATNGGTTNGGETSSAWHSALIACQCALATYATQKPARLVLSREEDFLFGPKKNEAAVKIKSAVDENGICFAAEITAHINLGAYAVNAGKVIEQVLTGSIGCYPLQHVQADCYAVTTNIPPCEPFGGGLSHGLFAAERQAASVAQAAKTDPLEWRVKHLKAKSLLGPLAERAALMSDYKRKWASYELLRKSRRQNAGEVSRGIGLAAGFQPEDEENAVGSAGGVADSGGRCWAAAVVEVEMDAVEYIPKIRNVWLCLEGGGMPCDNGGAADGTAGGLAKKLKVSASAAAGWAALEYLTYANGAIARSQYVNYTVAHVRDALNISFTNSDAPPKNIDRLPASCIPAALAAAVSQAADYHFCDIPLKREQILKALGGAHSGAISGAHSGANSGAQHKKGRPHDG